MDGVMHLIRLNPLLINCDIFVCTECLWFVYLFNQLEDSKLK